MNEGIVSTENPPTAAGTDLVPSGTDEPAEAAAEAGVLDAEDAAPLITKEIG
jgi:hypothetical protein